MLTWTTNEDSPRRPSTPPAVGAAFGALGLAFAILIPSGSVGADSPVPDGGPETAPTATHALADSTTTRHWLDEAWTNE